MNLYDVIITGYIDDLFRRFYCALVGQHLKDWISGVPGDSIRVVAGQLLGLINRKQNIT